MIGRWMHDLPDRVDHQTRILPYVMTGLTDDAQVRVVPGYDVKKFVYLMGVGVFLHLYTSSYTHVRIHTYATDTHTHTVSSFVFSLFLYSSNPLISYSSIPLFLCSCILP